jgi:ATP-dependent DNA helicase RecG
MLRFADLERDQWLVEKARDLSQQLLSETPDIADTHLARWLGVKEDYLRV